MIHALVNGVTKSVLYILINWYDYETLVTRVNGIIFFCIWCFVIFCEIKHHYTWEHCTFWWYGTNYETPVSKWNEDYFVFFVKLNMTIHGNTLSVLKWCVEGHYALHGNAKIMALFTDRVLHVSWFLLLHKLNPLMPTAAKTARSFCQNLDGKCIVRKIFHWKMSIRTSPTTLLQIFCKSTLNLKVIVKSIIDPDDNIWRKSLSINGLNNCYLLTATIWDQLSSLSTTPDKTLPIKVVLLAWSVWRSSGWLPVQQGWGRVL